MKVSIIVPTFNRAYLVTETIDSILNQTFRDFELIIVDNCSTDDTEKVIAGYQDERIRYFKNDNGGVIAVNRNYGISQAHGEYIAFCDDDDLWLPEKLEKQLLEFEKDSGLGLVCTNAVIFNETGELGSFHKTGLTAADFTLKSLIFGNLVICSSVLIKKSAIDSIGLFDTAPAIFTAEDFELWLRIARRYRLKYIDSPLVKYRIHSANIKKQASAAIKRNRAVYRSLLDKGVIERSLYYRLYLRALFIELLWRTRTIRLASWLKRGFCSGVIIA
jgi:glycosyltransferase involved in cell wall biosynthesis